MPFAVDPRSYDEKKFELRVLKDVASGSPQFSLKQLHTIIQKLAQKHIVIIDLRQEFHWFVRTCDNWIPINLFSPHFTYNRLKPSEDIINIEDQLAQIVNQWSWIQALHITEKNLGRIEDYRKITFKKDPSWKDFYITEKQLIKNYMPDCISYYRLPVQDHHFPSAKILDVLQKIQKDHPHAWFHFHCKAGRGRTTTFMILMDILKNKGKFTLQQYIDRQIKIGGPDFSRKKYKKHREGLKIFLHQIMSQS